MRLVNKSRDLDDETIREVIRFVCPPRVTKFDFTVKNRKRGIGSGWAHVDPGWQITIHLGAASLFPYRGGKERPGAYLPMPWMRDRTELLVYLAAHELRHLWQGMVPRGRRVWGSRGQYSERDACAYGIRMLRAWRRR